MLFLAKSSYASCKPLQLEDLLYHLIDQKAQEKGLSVSETLKLLLREAVGLRESIPSLTIKRCDVFCGIWDESDLEEFEQNTEGFRPR